MLTANVLVSPHLMLANLSRYNGVVGVELLGKLVERNFRNDLVRIVVELVVVIRPALTPFVHRFDPFGIDRRSAQFLELGHDAAQNALGIANDGHVRFTNLANFGRVDINMDDLGVRREFIKLSGHAIAEAGTGGNNEVAFRHGHVGVFGTMHAHGAQAQRMRAGEATFAEQRGNHGDLHSFRKRLQFLARMGAHDAAACVEQRALRGLDERGRLLDLLGIALVRGAIAGNVHAIGIVEHHFGALQIARNIDEHGTRTASRGDIECLAERLGKVVGRLQKEAVLHDGHGDAHNVRLLERVSADDSARDLARDNHHRNGIHVCGRDARHRVRGTRAARHQHNANLARGARVAVGHVRGALFVAGEHMVQLLAVVQRVVNFDGLATGVAEHGVDAFGLKRSDNRLGARHRFALVLGVAARSKRLAFNGELLLSQLVSQGVHHETYAPLSALETSFAYLASTPWLCLGAGATKAARRAASSSSLTCNSSLPPSISTVT